MTGSYGAFHDTGSYPITSTTSAYSASLGQTDITNGVFVSGSDKTKVYFTNAGIYNVQFSMQFENSNANDQDVQIWLRQGNDGGSSSDVSYTTGLISVPSKHGTSINGHVIASWNYLLSAVSNDYIQLMYQGTDTGITLVTYPAGTTPVIPVTPSTILTAQRVDTFLSNTGSFTGSFTGQLIGSASYATTASYIQNAQTASYVLQAVSSSYATTAVTSSYPISVTGSTLYSVRPSTNLLNTNNSIFFGGNAGQAATNATNAIFLGQLAGTQATNANQSIFFGIGAGNGAIDAAQSNFIGVAAGQNALSASFSTLIGYYAGYAPVATPQTSIGANNIIIGTNITLPDNTRDSINLGSIIFATGSYSTITGNPYSGSQYNIGKVGINKVLPQYTLDVSGSGNYSNGLTVTGSLSANSITGSLQGTSSWSSNSVTASYILNAASSSYAANGGVTQIIAGTNISISPSNGLGAVTINSAGGSSGAGTNTTASFTNLSTWTFFHGLGSRYVVIQALDSTFNQITPQNITLTDNNTATITFPTSESGYAIASLGGVGTTATSASYATTASYLNPLNQNIISTGSVTLSGSVTINSGSITMPDRPAFRVTGAGGGKTAVTTLSGSYLVVDYQQGTGWDNSTGTFTAPITGLYQANLIVRTNSNSLGTISQLIVYKNNTGGVTGTPQIMIEFGTNTSMNHTGGSTICKLAAGDTLKMVVAVGQISFDGNDNFSVAYIG